MAHPNTDEVTLELKNGCTISSGWIDKDDPDKLSCGDYVRLEDPAGQQLLYFGEDELRDGARTLLCSMFEQAQSFTLPQEDKLAIPFEQRAEMARRLYVDVYRTTESWEEEPTLGADVAYMLGALLDNDVCEWNANRLFVQVLRELYAPTEAIWQFIDVVTSPDDSADTDEGRVDAPPCV